MAAAFKVSVLIPTYKRANLLGYVLEGLRRQMCRDFEVIIVLKPSGDGTEKVVENYGRWLKIDLVLQSHGYVVDALNLGLMYASGDIIAFLDDDAVPSVDWVQRHIESYERYENVGGVAGNVIPAKLFSDTPERVAENASHIIPSFRTPTFFERVFSSVWNVLLEGMEDFLLYISKAGVVGYNLSISRFAWSCPVKSLLGMGANMSVLSEAVFLIPKA
ncbi:MAG: glycosyltransferase family A protein [Candidatus Bathyarchaeia archaeon]